VGKYSQRLPRILNEFLTVDTPGHQHGRGPGPRPAYYGRSEAAINTRQLARCDIVQTAPIGLGRDARRDISAIPHAFRDFK
jgi:hypothetical protein